MIEREGASPYNNNGTIVYFAMYGGHPLRNVTHPHPHDVLCGRGGGTNAHVGNSHWRMLVAANKEMYVSLPKKQKMLLSKSIVNAVRSQNPPGRFLQKDNKTNLWYDVGDQRAQEKTSQALREGAPVIRSKMKDSGSEEEDDGSVSPEKSQPSDEKSPKVSRVSSGNVSLASPVPLQQYPSQTMQPPPPPPPPVYVSSAGPMGMMYAPQPPQYPFPSPHSIPPHGVPPPPAYPQNHSSGTFPPIILNPHGMPHGMAVVLPAPVPAQGPVPDRNRKPKSPARKKGDSVSGEGRDANKTPEDNSRHPETQSPRNGSNQDPKERVDPIPYKSDSNFQQHKSHPQSQGQNTEPYYGDETAPLPPAKLDDHVGCSFGSIGMSDSEHARLLDGSAYNQGGVQHYNGAQNHYQQTQQQYYNHYQSSSYPDHPHQYRQDSYPPPSRPPLQPQQPQQQFQYRAQEKFSESNDMAPLPVDGGLDGGVGFSFGSIMSLDGPKLDGGVGLSFGSAMSFSVRGDIAPPDGGLEGIGTSFGSMSLTEHKTQPVDGGLDGVGTSFGSFSSATQDRDKLMDAAQQLTDEDEAALHAKPPSFRQQKSKGSLLECSDTDSEDEASGSAKSAQKSADWQKLQETWAAQQMPPNCNVPPNFGPSYSSSKRSYHSVPRDVPATNLGRDLSQMSAISVGDFNDHYQVVMPAAAGYPNADNSYPSCKTRDDMNTMPPPPPAIRKQPEYDLCRSEGDQYQAAFGGL